MKILQLGKFYPIRGGVEKVMRDLTEGLSGRGVRCDMLCAWLPGDGADQEDRPLVHMEGRMQVIRLNDCGSIYCAPAMARAAATMLSPAMIIWLRRHAREYDIIHVHHPDPMAALALWLSGFRGRVILHWHSDILKQKTLLKLYQPLQRWLTHRAETIVGTTPVYVAESPWLQHVQDKVTYVPIGIRPVPPAEVPEKDGTVRIFSIGRLVGYKGYCHLVEAMKYLPDRYRLVIGGKGPLEDELRSQAEREGVAGRITLAGYVPAEDLPACFHSCDVYVVSSVWKTEAFCIAQIEAMSAGKPVVATTIPASGVSWVNADGVSGLNVPPGDAKALAGAILALTADPATQKAFSERARERFETLFTMDSMLDGVSRIYGL